MHTERHVDTGRRQRGLASVETALMAPFLLLMLLLAVAGTQLMQVRIGNVADLRTATWRNVLFDAPCNVGAAALSGAITQCPNEDHGRGEFLNNLGSSPFAQTVRSAVATTGASSRRVRPYRIGDFGSVVIEDQYAVDTMAPWDIHAMELGYDRYLRGRLSRYIFPNYFPRVR